MRSVDNPRNAPKRGSLSSILLTLFSYFFFGAICFHLGFIFGGGEKVWSYISSDTSTLHRLLKNTDETVEQGDDGKISGSTISLPNTVRRMFVDMTTVSRDDFIEEFDIGVPWDESRKGSSEVLLFYGSEFSRPGEHDQGITSVVQATENCETLKVILTKPDQKHQCLAIVPQWDSYHVHKFMRLKDDADNSMTKVLDWSHPLRYVSRRHESSGKQVQFPIKNQTTRYLKMLQDYLEKLDSTFERLKPLATKVAGSDKTVVVLVVNWGQSELLFNFVCNARARGLDLSKILVFATDKDASDLAKSLDIAVFDVNDSFGTLPKKAAVAYGDRTFQHMMFSKVYCVHLINAMGYDILFQDVDVIWYKDPLPFFKTPESGDFDFYFQDDGAHSSRYMPYSPNSGFYFIRFNERTQYFFQEFIRKGDLIIASGSHQSVLNELLTDHSSSRGLRTKVFGRDSPLGKQFPGGFHYHKRKQFMKELLQKEQSAYIFHMSWTKNKTNKRLFYQQMGEWYLKSQCVEKTVGELEESSSECCAAQPIFECHYRDKPSIRPCTDSDPIDKRGKSFW